MCQELLDHPEISVGIVQGFALRVAYSADLHSVRAEDVARGTEDAFEGAAVDHWDPFAVASSSLEVSVVAVVVAAVGSSEVSGLVDFLAGEQVVETFVAGFAAVPVASASYSGPSGVVVYLVADLAH